MLSSRSMSPILTLLLASCVTPPVDKSATESASESAPPDDSGRETGPLPDSAETAHTGETGPETAHTDETGPAPTAGPAVILFIGDGMGFPHVAGGGVYKTGVSGSLTMETLPWKGQLRTASLNGITDSAAAGTVYASGEKTWNGMLGLDRNEEPLESLMDLARARGLRTGVVTTDTLTGATPSAFMVNVSSRGDTEEIAAGIVAELPDVLLGGGADALNPLLTGMDVQLVTTADALTAAVPDHRPLVGLFSPSTFPYVLAGYTTEPTLEQMTQAALADLGGDGSGFFLMVEGARIDHASHGNREDEVHRETVAFDDAIAAAMAWAGERDDVTIVVTADHECGGMIVAETGTAGETPTTRWRWGVHTNADVPVFAMGDKASLLNGERLDALWVHEVLEAAIEETEVEEPNIVPLIDGWLEDLDPAVTTQTWDTSFGSGFNQLDGLHLGADADGLRLGVDGVFDRQENAVVLLIDMDYGEGTGFGGDGSAMPDAAGQLEMMLSEIGLEVGLSGLGFDLAIATIAATEIETRDLDDLAGLRGLREPWAYDGDLWWLPAIVNLDYGNVAIEGDEAVDAGATGLTENGLEAMLWWSSTYPDGLPAEGLTIAVVAVLVNSDGTWASNQALPPLATADEPGEDAIPIVSAALITVDADGVMVGDAERVE